MSQDPVTAGPVSRQRLSRWDPQRGSIRTSAAGEEGLRRLFRQFSFPGGIPSHVAPTTPGSIHEGGELGYSLLHAYGAVFDNPDLVAVCVIGDDELESLLKGYGYAPRFLEGSDPIAMHQRMAATLDEVLEDIATIQARAREDGESERPRRLPAPAARRDRRDGGLSGRVDVLVFTGGVGERSPEVRRRTVEGLGFLGAGDRYAAKRGGER